jgi:hypothetical protein
VTRRLPTRRNLALVAIAMGLLLPAGANASPTVSATLPATLSATSMAVTVFQYHGLQTVTTAGGTFLAMEFGMATAAITGFSLLTPCEAHAGIGSTRYHMGSTTAAAIPGITTIRVTALTATLSDPAPGGPPAPVAWTVLTPPVAGALLVGDAGTLSNLTATLADANAGGMSFAHLNLQQFIC